MAVQTTFTVTLEGQDPSIDTLPFFNTTLSTVFTAGTSGVLSTRTYYDAQNGFASIVFPSIAAFQSSPPTNMLIWNQALNGVEVNINFPQWLTLTGPSDTATVNFILAPGQCVIIPYICANRNARVTPTQPLPDFPYPLPNFPLPSASTPAYVDTYFF